MVTAIYRVTGAFSKDELYGLTFQLRRAAVSIPSNIAEGQGRLGAAEFRHFLPQARGSLMELETQVLIAERLCYVRPEPAREILLQAAELGRVLNGLLNSLSTGN